MIMTQTIRAARWRAAVVAGVLGAGACIAAVPLWADHGLPHPELLGRGTFIDDVGLTVRNKIAGRGTGVVHMQDSSDLVVLRISIQAGGIAPWHGHTGVGFLVNLGPGVVTNYVGEDCEPRQFYPGDAFVDPGHGDLHAVRNDSNAEVVILATFLGVEGAPVIPEPGPSHCNVL
jgi:quercetin dioxygenase-like cupin family protein